jgi:hypothetical protein
MHPSNGQKMQPTSKQNEEEPCLVLRIDGERKLVTPEELRDDEFFAELPKECAETKSSVHVSLAHLLDQPPDHAPVVTLFTE